MKVFNPYLRIIAGFLSWRLLLLILILVAPRFFPLKYHLLGADRETVRQKPLLWVHANFDGEHYVGIAKFGYRLAEQAFFPLYPNLIKKLSPLFNSNSVLVGIVISNISFPIALIFLYKLIKLDYSNKVALLTLMFLLIFPTSFYFGAVYTESLFLALTVVSFYAARKGRWGIAGVFGMLAASTRFIGIFLFPALLAERLIQRKTSKKTNLGSLLSICLIPLGLIYYMGFLKSTTGDPFLFARSLTHYGEFRSQKVILIYQVFWRYLKMLVTVDKSSEIYPIIIVEVITGIVFLVTSVLSLARQRLSYSLFNLLAFLTPTLTGSFVSLPRYVLICFPSFLLIDQFFLSHKKLTLVYFLISTLTLFYLWMRFSMGYWVA